MPLLGDKEKQSLGEQPWKDLLLERHLVQPSEIPEHEHPDLCLHLQLSGNADFEWWSAKRNAVSRTEPGSMILIPAGTRDRLRWKGSSERLILSVDQHSLASFAQDMDSEYIPEFRAGWSFRDQGLRQILSEMGKQARDHWPLGGLYADLLTVGLKTRLIQNHAVNPATRPTLKGGLGMPRLKRTMEFINANLGEDVRLDTIAKELGVSSSHFAHEFRNSTGQTPYQYLLEQRMAKAKHLLLTTKLPVQVVGGLVGFSSPVNFVRAFRQRLRTTPETWRKSDDAIK
ncbi:AraC family transcriptional regulator [Edaphobacter paludis]|uniref:AraC family transcriptional regulator n=1 Tax=Edaphobacter paludis TaxID=3035702 RepID=A0AAU7D9C9_9BACT